MATNAPSNPATVIAIRQFHSAANDDGPRVLVIGAGPAGVRFSHEFLRRQPNARLTLFGDEPYLPYNRVQLSALLAGDIQYEDILSPLPGNQNYPNFLHINVRIERLDTEHNCVFDEHGRTYFYDNLVLATGSRPHIPHILGTSQTGVYTFRSLKDAESLYNRIARARHVVVVGGGLLGLEAARALLRANTFVTVIQQGPRLMNRQLDDAAAHYLGKKVAALGIRVITDSGVRQILGEGRVTGVVTRDGDKVICDTVLLCAGIKPVIDLARSARLKVSNGILVDDTLQTSAQNVYAIGECCEHRGKTYGLVNPGFEQAAIAADVIAKGSARYVGSLEISQLKVLGETVCSMGEVAEITPRPFLRQWVYQNKRDGLYRKIVTFKGRLIGAVGFGEWPEVRRVQEAFQNQRRLLPWQYLRFSITGNLWSGGDDDVRQWPSTTVVCQCNGVTQGTLMRACQTGTASLTQISQQTSAGTVCGSCKPLLEKMLGESGQREAIGGANTLLCMGLLTLLATVLTLYLPALKVSGSVLEPTLLENIWNNKFWKQVTGFTLLGLSAAGLLMSLRKRIRNIRLGQYFYWRILHVLLGTACFAVLFLHTGLNSGNNLNRWLLLNFVAILGLGALVSFTLAVSHRLSTKRASANRKFLTWIHILLTWPFPVLVTVHILTVYFF